MNANKVYTKIWYPSILLLLWILAYTLFNVTALAFKNYKITQILWYSNFPSGTLA